MGKQGKDYRALRGGKGLNQCDFWAQVGVTQSGGSRYESGRNVPKPVAELVRLHHELGIDTRLITHENVVRILAVLERKVTVSL